MYRVDGFDFESEDMAEIARKEKNGIKYIKEKTKRREEKKWKK